MLTSDEKTRIEEIKQREQAATTGPWTIDDCRFGRYKGGISAPYEKNICGTLSVSVMHFGDDVNGNNSSPPDEEDEFFIAHARQDIPYLLELVERLEAENERLRKQTEWQPPEVQNNDRN